MVARCGMEWERREQNMLGSGDQRRCLFQRSMSRTLTVVRLPLVERLRVDWKGNGSRRWLLSANMYKLNHFVRKHVGEDRMVKDGSIWCCSKWKPLILSLNQKYFNLLSCPSQISVDVHMKFAENGVCSEVWSQS